MSWPASAFGPKSIKEIPGPNPKTRSENWDPKSDPVFQGLMGLVESNGPFGSLGNSQTTDNGLVVTC